MSDQIQETTMTTTRPGSMVTDAMVTAALDEWTAHYHSIVKDLAAMPAAEPDDQDDRPAAEPDDQDDRPDVGGE
ncbi:MAG: hypothetical protein M3440_06650 [Chloroflexota bacterium]|nr:hypothetical protein [Chloroflexota bacterium]